MLIVIHDNTNIIRGIRLRVNISLYYTTLDYMLRLGLLWVSRN